jgi:hypothetical protein
MSLVVDSSEYLSCLNCIVDRTMQTDVTASKLQAFALKTLLPAYKSATTTSQLQEVQDYVKTYKIIEEQFPVNSQARARVAEVVVQLEKCKKERFAAHPILQKLSKDWKDTEELWEMLTLANKSIKEDSALEPLLPSKLLNVLNAVKRMRKTASEYLDKKTLALYAAYDAATKNSFSSLMQIYKYCDLKTNKSAMISSLVKDYLGLHANPAQMEKQFSQKVTADIDGLIQTNFSAYDWIKENASFIVTPYNHGNEEDPEGGACRQNCTARQVLLLKNPKMATRDLPLGSSEWTRSVRNQLKRGPRMIVNAQMSHREMGEPFYAPFGLQLDNMVSLDSVEDLPALLDKHAKPFLLRLANEVVGHVINVQCDSKNQIFRFVCDGIGSVEYKSKEALIKGLTSYIKAFYPGWGNFLVDFASPISK